ncbi:MAG: nitroreductase family protein [Oscillospiraceae bacterium]|jgi:nitroreductase|nr:nitroreductase family protein [Oscillospiraceae bacterium]
MPNAVQAALIARRSIRRFTREAIPDAVLRDILEAARLSPTGGNAQPLRFIAVRDSSLCTKVFSFTHWAGSIPDGSASPADETQPSAYVLILVDKQIRQSADTDAGAAAMSIMLSAAGAGVASCWLGAIERKEIQELLNIDAERFSIHTIVALGYPAQKSRAVEMVDSVKYYLESPDALCVPKRRAEDIIKIL